MKTMSDYTIYCTPEQTKKALALGAKITWCEKERKVNDRTLHEKGKCYKYFIPTAEQMVGWIEEQGFQFESERSYEPTNDGNIIGYGYKVVKPLEFYSGWIYKTTRKEAILAAIDAALDYLEEGGNK